MAGFLRKKSRQEPPPKPISSPSSPSKPVTPLFARFATTATQPQNDAQRVVSSPMLLSGRKESGAGPPVSRSSGTRSASVVPAREADVNRRRSQISHPHSVQNPMPNGTQTMQPRQSLSNELRPGLHMNLEKPLPPPTPYNRDPNPSLPPQQTAPTNRRMSASVSPPPTTYQTQPNQLRSRTPSVRDGRLPPPPQTQQDNLRQTDPPVGQSQFLNNGVPFNTQQHQFTPTRSGTLPPPITNHKPQPHLPSSRPPTSEGHLPARNFAAQQSPSVQNLQREVQPHSPVAKLPNVSASLNRLPERYRNTRSPDLPAPPVPQDTAQAEFDLPPEFALFQKFSSPLPSPSVSAHQILPDTKPTGQDPTSSAGRSTIKIEKSAPEIRSVHPVNGSAPLQQASSNIMGINASHLPNQPFISPSEKQSYRHSRSISPPRRLPVPPATKAMQSFSAKDEKSEQLAPPIPVSTIDYRPSRTPEPPSSGPSFKSPMNGARPLPPSPPQSPVRTPPPLIKGRPLIFNPPLNSPLVAPPPPVPKAKTWDPEWDDPPESEPEPEPTNAYPSPAPTTHTTPRPEVFRTRGGENNNVVLVNGHFDTGVSTQFNSTGMPPPNPPAEVLPTFGTNENVQASRPSESRSLRLPTPPSPPQQQQQPAQTELQHSPQLPETPSRVNKKLSKSRSAGPGDTAAVRAPHTHSHANSIAVSSPSMHPVQRIRKTSIPKSLLKTPVVPSPALPEKPEATAQLDELTIRNAGLPLDDDPFAKVEGVKMMLPKESKRSQLKDQEVPSSTESTNGSNVLADETQLAVPADENIPEITDESKPPVTKPSLTPVTPEEYRQARSQRRGGPLERLPSDLLEDVVVREDRPPEPFPLILFISDPRLLSILLSFMSFYDWCILCSITREIRIRLVQTPALREEILERFFKTVGYSRWSWNEREPLSLSLQDLNDYMRGVSTPSHEYARVAKLYVHSLSVHPEHRDPGLIDVLHGLAASTRAYTRVVLRLRAQAEKEANVQMFTHPGRNGYTSPSRGGPSRASSRAPSPTQSSFSHSQHGGASSATAIYTPPTTTFRSPLFRIRRAPLLRVFVPSPEGDWLSDRSVLECEAELKHAGIVGLMRAGDVVWDMGVGDEGNVGRLVWDGSYLIDLDYTYSAIGDLPKYMPTLAFPPSYFHRVIRTSVIIGNPIIHIDITPWGEEIAANLQLMQDRVRTETPQGGIHNVVRWVHRSSFVIRPPPRGSQRAFTPPNSRSHPSRVPIPESDNLFVDPGWYGTIVVETEGTKEAIADLQVRCGPSAFPPRARGVNDQATKAQYDNRKVFRILREKSRPGEIWIKTVGPKERLM